MKKEIEAFVNAANEQELESAWNNLAAEEQRIFEQLMEEDLSLIHISVPTPTTPFWLRHWKSGPAPIWMQWCPS